MQHFEDYSVRGWVVHGLLTSAEKPKTVRKTSRSNVEISMLANVSRNSIPTPPNDMSEIERFFRHNLARFRYDFERLRFAEK